MVLTFSASEEHIMNKILTMVEGEPTMERISRELWISSDECDQPAQAEERRRLHRNCGK